MTHDRKGEPVLVIDDERDIRDGCERILSRMGCQVTKAADGEEGLAILDRRPVWVVLLDLKMPGMGGIELLPIIKERRPEILVIVITGYATLEMAVEAMKRGAYDFIAKPFEPDQLRITVGRALERCRLAREARELAEQRRRTLADLHTEQSRTRTIIRALPFGVAVTNTECQVVLMNPAFRKMTGLAPDAPPGERLFHYVPDQGLCDLVEGIAQDPEADDRRSSHEFSVGGEKHLLALATPVRSEAEEYLGTVLVLMDITPFKALDDLRSDFVAKVSHDLRSPLSTIYLQLSLLLSDDEEDQDPKNRQLLVRAKERTQGLISFVRDVMEISRIETQGVRSRVRDVRLEEVLETVVESLSDQAENRGQKLTLETPPEALPVLRADQASLESVFNNLAANAVNYTPDGGSITLKAVREGDFIRVDVSDDGFGIAADKLEIIFEKFYRVKTEKTRYVTGTGLGLPIVKSVVEGLGGRIEVQSQPDQGSTFSVFLPLDS